MLDCADSLLSPLNDGLDLSKIEAGKLELETDDFDLLWVAESVTNLIAQRAAGRGIEVVCNVQPDVPIRLRGDGQRLRQVLLDLTGNAIKFTERGEVTIAVRVVAQDPDAVTLVLSVADTGIGIPTDRREAIFEAFTQVDGSITRRFGGTGLGLTITRQLVELMGGAIWVDGELGQGMTFHVRPRFDRSPAQAAAGDGAAAHPREPPVGQAAGRRDDRPRDGRRPRGVPACRLHRLPDEAVPRRRGACGGRQVDAAAGVRRGLPPRRPGRSEPERPRPTSTAPGSPRRRGAAGRRACPANAAAPRGRPSVRPSCRRPGTGVCRPRRLPAPGT